MLERHPRTLLATATLLLTGLTACGGGGSGDEGTGSTGLSAGANRSVLTLERLSFTAAAPEASGITTFLWQQTAGLAVNLSVGAPGSVSFVAPDRAANLEFEVIGSTDAGTEVGRDRVIVEVTSSRPEINSELRSIIEVRGGGEGRAIAAAVHTASQRLFVIDGIDGDVLAYDVSAPGAPNFLGVVEAARATLGFTPGVPLSVASGDDGAVAITWSGETLEFPGVIQLIDPGTLQALVQVSTTGANPVDVEVTADGQLFAVACAGDAPSVGAGDGFGYVTLLRVPAGGPSAVDVHDDVFPVVLNPFDGDESNLAQSGIRFFANNPRASVELTPRSVTIAPDGATVWASCPENDALVVIDVASSLITDLVALEDRDFGSSGRSFESGGLRQIADQMEAVATTPTGETIPFGGITGIIDIISNNATGVATLRTVSAAGPALGPLDRNGNSLPDVTLVDPNASLSIQTSTTNPLSQSRQLNLIEAAQLTGPNGEVVTGRPGLYSASAGFAGHDEEMLDLVGAEVLTDAFGARFGGATRATDGSSWLGEMRRNGLWRLSGSGQLIERYVPEGTPAAFGTETLPAVFAQRRLNPELEPGQRYGGFGAVANHSERGSVFAAPRLPLDNPDTAADTASRASRIARLLEVDAGTGAAVGEYVVVLEAVGHALEGMTFVPSIGSGNSTSNVGLYLLESSTSPSGFRGIYRIDVEQATNLRSLSAADYAAVSAVLETTAPGALGDLPTPIEPVQKTLRVDLRAIGLDGGIGQPSALAALGDFSFYVAFDDGHQLSNATVSSATSSVLNIDNGGTQFGLAVLSSSRADFSGTGSTLEFSSHSIQGLTQPLDLVAIESNGVSQLLTADGGFARVLEPTGSASSFDERLTVGGLLLDTNVFTSPAELQDPLRSGNLRVSSIGSDVNSDGLVDRLFAFGGRSISARDRLGRQLWQSSIALEQRAFEESPSAVLGSATQFGIRPSSLAVGLVEGARVLAAGLEGGGAVMLYDLSQASAPLLSGVASRATRPVDVDIASIEGTTLFVTDAARGRIEILRLTRLP